MTIPFLSATPPPPLSLSLSTLSNTTTVAEEKAHHGDGEYISLRLPVKSLLRFKCVCKSWFSTISDTHFANSQFQFNAATHIHRALFISTQTRSIDLEASLDDETAYASLNLNVNDYSRIEVKGSCRGFIFLHCSSSFYIWNPSTGVYKQIPLCSNLDFDYFYGFGYDQLTQDYLVVSMSDDISPQLLEFFSLRANMWKQIKGTHIKSMHANEGGQKVGLFFNGVIHWFAYCLDLKKEVIVAFDLMERKLLDMNLPDDFGYEFDRCGLWVFREFLSVWGRHYDNDTVEIWVMKEYKEHSSWTKTHVLPIDAIPTKYFSPLCSTKSSDIVGTDDSTILVKYNDEGQLLGHRYCNDPHGTQVVMYTESLLSLPEDNVPA